MMTDDLYRALQHCLEMVHSGVPVEECLAQHPGHVAELRPLVLAAIDSSNQSHPGMPPAARARIRQRVMEYWDKKHAPRWPWPRLSFLRWAATAAATVLLVLAGGMGVVSAAQDSVPGSALYQVKHLREEAGLWLATSSDRKVALYSTYIQERAREMSELAQRGDTAAIPTSLSRLEEHLKDVDGLAETANASTVRSSKLSIMESLEGVPSFAASAHKPQETMGQVLEGAYPCLQHTTEVLRKARERAAAAAEKVGARLSESGTSLVSGADTLCPR